MAQRTPTKNEMRSVWGRLKVLSIDQWGLSLKIELGSQDIAKIRKTPIIAQSLRNEQFAASLRALRRECRGLSASTVKRRRRRSVDPTSPRSAAGERWPAVFADATTSPSTIVSSGSASSALGTAVEARFRAVTHPQPFAVRSRVKIDSSPTKQPTQQRVTQREQG